MGNQQGGENVPKQTIVVPKPLQTQIPKTNQENHQPTATIFKSDEYMIMNGKKISAEKLIDNVMSWGVLNLDKANLSNVPLPSSVGNFLKSLKKEEKRGKVLKELNLFENHLTQIPQGLCDIDEGFLIQFFFLFINQFSPIPTHCLDQIFVSADKTAYISENLEIMDLSSNSFQTFGDPTDPRSLVSFLAKCCNLKTLLLVGNNLHSFPNAKMAKFLPKLQSLDMRGNFPDFKAIPEIFSGFKFLKRLNMSGLGVEEASDDIFKNFECLEELNLSHNKLLTIPSSIFRLKKLKKLFIFSNKLQSFFGNVFEDNVKHGKIVLDDSEMHVFEKFFMKTLKSKEDRAANKIFENFEEKIIYERLCSHKRKWLIEQEKESEIKLIEKIITSDPALNEAANGMDYQKWHEKFNEESFFKLFSDKMGYCLEIFEFSDNCFHYLPEIFGFILERNCKQVLGCWNEIENIPNSFSRLDKNLEMFDLSFNSISFTKEQLSIKDTSPITNFKNLGIVNLCSNEITQIPQSFLSKCNSLVDINLSSNKLTALPLNFFNDMKKLQKINFSYNGFPVFAFPFESMRNCGTSLLFLSLSGNKFESFPIEKLCWEIDATKVDATKVEPKPQEQGNEGFSSNASTETNNNTTNTAKLSISLQKKKKKKLLFAFPNLEKLFLGFNNISQAPNIGLLLRLLQTNTPASPSSKTSSGRENIPSFSTKLHDVSYYSNAPTKPAQPFSYSIPNSVNANGKPNSSGASSSNADSSVLSWLEDNSPVSKEFDFFYLTLAGNNIKDTDDIMNKIFFESFEKMFFRMERLLKFEKKPDDFLVRYFYLKEKEFMENHPGARTEDFYEKLFDFNPFTLNIKKTFFYLMKFKTLDLSFNNFKNSLSHSILSRDVNVFLNKQQRGEVDSNFSDQNVSSACPLDVVSPRISLSSPVSENNNNNLSSFSGATSTSQQSTTSPPLSPGYAASPSFDNSVIAIVCMTVNAKKPELETESFFTNSQSMSYVYPSKDNKEKPNSKEINSEMMRKIPKGYLDYVEYFAENSHLMKLLVILNLTSKTFPALVNHIFVAMPIEKKEQEKTPVKRVKAIRPVFQLNSKHFNYQTFISFIFEDCELHLEGNNNQFDKHMTEFFIKRIQQSQKKRTAQLQQAQQSIPNPQNLQSTANSNTTDTSPRQEQTSPKEKSQNGIVQELHLNSSTFFQTLPIFDHQKMSPPFYGSSKYFWNEAHSSKSSNVLYASGELRGFSRPTMEDAVSLSGNLISHLEIDNRIFNWEQFFEKDGNLASNFSNNSENQINNPDKEIFIDFFAVFDGHAGPNCSSYCAEEVPKSIKEAIMKNIEKKRKLLHSTSTANQQIQTPSAISATSSPNSNLNPADLKLNLNMPKRNAANSLSSTPKSPTSPCRSPESTKFLRLHDFKAILRTVLLETDQKIQKELKFTDGCTCCACMLIHVYDIVPNTNKKVEDFEVIDKNSEKTRTNKRTFCVFANIGDSRAVLCRKMVQNPENVYYYPVTITEDHKPMKERELRRIKDLGFVVMNGRVQGLGVSRAIGDASAKAVVSCEPDIFSFEAKFDEDVVIFLGCDGIWDVITEKKIVDMTTDCFDVCGEVKSTNKENIEKIEKNLAFSNARLRDYAMSIGSSDNISLCMIQLTNSFIERGK